MSLSKCEVKNNLKKRASNPEFWQDKKLKSFRNSGVEYVNKRGKGSVVAAKNPPISARGCSMEKCYKNGCTNLLLDKVLQLFHQFYTLSYNEQNMFLYNCLHIHEPTTRRQGKADYNSRKLASFQYTVDERSVCKQTLMNIFQIGRSRLANLQKK